MLPTPFLSASEHRQIRSFTQDAIPFLHNIIFRYTNPLSFETEPHHIHNIPLIREHADSYLYYFRYKTLETTSSQSPFQIIFNPVHGINTGTYYRTIHPQNITLSNQDVSITYMNELIEHNENLDTPLYLPSHLESLKEKHDYFEVSNLETKIQRHNNPHFWLQQDILQIKQFQYKFFQNIILNEDTVPQIKIFAHFLLKFFRFNYQLFWEQQDQNAYIHFLQVLTETELLPFLINNKYRHVHFRDLTTFNTDYIEQIHLDTSFIVEHSETSDSRPYTTTNLLSQTSLVEYNPNTLQHNTGQNLLHLNQDENIELAPPQDPQQLNIVSHQYQDTNILQNESDQSETVTIQNVSEISDATLNNSHSVTITDDSNAIQIPVHHITQHITTDPNQYNPNNNPDQENISTLSTSNTHLTQPLQTQHPSPRNYDPPPPPLQHSAQTTPHNSPQQGSSHTQNLTTLQTHPTVQFQTNTPTRHSPLQHIPYTPAQNTQTQNIQPGLTINTLHSNTLPHHVTSRNRSRPPLQTIPNNPLSYSLTSTNPNSTQNFTTNNNQINTLNPSSISQTSNPTRNLLQTTQFQTFHPPSTTIRTNPHINATYTQPTTNPSSISSNIPTYNTIPPSTIPQSMISNPTYINSSTSISEPIKPLDGLDHNYTPEEYLQHIEARVTFS